MNSDKVNPIEDRQELKRFIFRAILFGLLFLTFQLLAIWLIWNTVLCKVTTFTSITIWQAALILGLTALVKVVIKTILSKFMKITKQKELIRDCDGKWKLRNKI
jgi:hypothetical protein